MSTINFSDFTSLTQAVKYKFKPDPLPWYHPASGSLIYANCQEKIANYCRDNNYLYPSWTQRLEMAAKSFFIINIYEGAGTISGIFENAIKGVVNIAGSCVYQSSSLIGRPIKKIDECSFKTGVSQLVFSIGNVVKAVFLPLTILISPLKIALWTFSEESNLNYVEMYKDHQANANAARHNVNNPKYKCYKTALENAGSADSIRLRWATQFNRMWTLTRTSENINACYKEFKASK